MLPCFLLKAGPREGEDGCLLLLRKMNLELLRQYGLSRSPLHPMPCNAFLH